MKLSFSLKAERSCLDRSKTKALYVNLCTNEVKKIRELKCASNGGGGKTASTSVSSSTDTARASKFHQAIAKYKITKVLKLLSYLSAFLSVCMFVCLSVFLPVSLSVCMYLCLSVSLSVCHVSLSVSLSVCLLSL
jgi:hypothetical protein